MQRDLNQFSPIQGQRLAQRRPAPVTNAVRFILPPRIFNPPNCDINKRCIQRGQKDFMHIDRDHNGYTSPEIHTHSNVE